MSQNLFFTSQNHSAEGCKNQWKCVNCGSEHPSLDRECIKLKEETEIVRIKVDKGVPFKEARWLYKKYNDIHKSKWMSQAMNEKPTSEMEQIDKTIMHEIKKIKKHIIPEIKNEIKIAVQKFIQEITKKTTNTNCSTSEKKVG